MQCLSPISIENPRFRLYSGETSRIAVPCGKCEACLSRKRQDWFFRLKQELKLHSNAHFITITYDDEHLPHSGNVSKRDCQLFMKRLRKSIEPYKVRYFLCAEYGPTTYRPHYHLILFGFPNGFDVEQVVTDSWKNGFVTIGTVTDASINYVCKYCINKSLEIEGKTPVFALMSTRPALGSNYVERYMRYHKSGKKFYCSDEFGRKQAMPRYYREKIFDEDERRLHSKLCQIEAQDHFEQLEKSYPSHNPFLLDIQQKSDYQRKLKKTLEKTSKL